MEKTEPRIPDWFEPRGYQIDAINKWCENEFSGIFSMATGTGKTLTAILSILKLMESNKSFLTIILCPYVNLVDQWVKEVEKFSFSPIQCYSKFPGWKSKVSNKVSQLNRNVVNNPVFIMSNSSFVLDETQDIINRCKKDILIIVDEAHYAGAESLSKYLDQRFRYRLGLTATPNRYFDDAGTSFILKYFRGEVFSFDLKQAIEEGYLTPYYYYPVKVYMTNEEFFEYRDYSEKIARIGQENLSESQIAYKEILLQKRAKIIHAAFNKYDKLREVMSKYQYEKNILVYCGATDASSEDSESQIDCVCKILGTEYGMSIGKYTYEESIEERTRILDRFENDKMLQALVAIKCLDEGVDIPSVQTAIIISSSTNPKEYIQRRGRVLRKFEGKEFSSIVDFVVLPPKVAKLYDHESIVSSVITKEARRVKDFAELAINHTDCDNFINGMFTEFGVKNTNGGKNG